MADERVDEAGRFDGLQAKIPSDSEGPEARRLLATAVVEATKQRRERQEWPRTRDARSRRPRRGVSKKKKKDGGGEKKKRVNKTLARGCLIASWPSLGSPAGFGTCATIALSSPLLRCRSRMPSFAIAHSPLTRYRSFARTHHHHLHLATRTRRRRLVLGRPSVPGEARERQVGAASNGVAGDPRRRLGGHGCVCDVSLCC